MRRIIPRILSRLALLALLALPLAACSEPTTGGRHPGHLRIVAGDQQTGAVGTPLTSPLTVQLLAIDTLPLAGRQIDFRVVAGSADLQPPSGITDEQGRASTSVTLQTPGSAQVSATVYSSSLSVSFLLAASGPAPANCDGPPLTPVVTAVITPLGGPGVCLGATSTDADYVIIAHNSSTDPGNTEDISLWLAGSATSQPELGASRMTAVMNASQPPFAPRAHTLTNSLPRPLNSVVGDWVPVNVDLTNSCANPVTRRARVVGTAPGIVLLADSTNPENAIADVDMQSVAVFFDTLLNSTDTLNFRPPADVDDNQSLVLLFTHSVNELPDTPPHLARRALFQSRDLNPATTEDTLPGTSVCSGSNEAELLYVAIPDPAGQFGAPLSLAGWRAQLPRALAHEHQHLINASRRFYRAGATALEESWLDEALSQIAEEGLFQRAGSRASRQNIGSLEIATSTQTRNAYELAQRYNVESYGLYLAAPESVTPFSASSRAATGAAWSLIRYLADHRDGHDFDFWNRLIDTTTTGIASLQPVFGGRLRSLIRDWSTSAVIDDLFATSAAYQQPSWNWRSLFAVAGTYPLQPRVVSATPSTVTIAAGSAAYYSVHVAAGGSVHVRWEAGGGGTISPLIQWTVVRVN